MVGRPPLGPRALTNAEVQARYRARQAAHIAAQSAVIAAARKLLKAFIAAGGDSAFMYRAIDALGAALAALDRETQP